jgi:hypothetical protein
MTEFVNLYLGEPTENVQNKSFFKRAEYIEAETTEAPADIAEHYNVSLKVRTRDGEKYCLELDSRTVNNWLTRFKPILKEELKSDDGIDGEYHGKERNVVIVRILMKLVGAWVNTSKATKLN